MAESDSGVICCSDANCAADVSVSAAIGVDDDAWNGRVVCRRRADELLGLGV